MAVFNQQGAAFNGPVQRGGTQTNYVTARHDVFGGSVSMRNNDSHTFWATDEWISVKPPPAAPPPPTEQQHAHFYGPVAQGGEQHFHVHQCSACHPPEPKLQPPPQT